SEEGSLRDEIPQAGLESQPAARCAGNRQAEIGNHKERFGATMRVSRVSSPMFPYCSKEKAVSEQDAKHPTIETGLILQS
ncbi:MAG: hypothetical protein MR821_11230, partial [Clostridiales bacterium]|nr:hypothetical protein [Clostridiales bacterium]